MGRIGFGFSPGPSYNLGPGDHPMNIRHAWTLMRWGTLAIAASPAHAADLAVGPGRAFTSIEAALTCARPGDTILVHPLPANRPYEAVALQITQPRLTIRAVIPAGQRVPLSGKGFDYSGRGPIPRALIQFNRGADDALVEGFELFGAHNASHNGAGVRINQANRVTLRDCDLHGNDMGLMSNGDGTPQTAADQRVESCRIHDNGDRTDPGYNHNLYLGGTSVTLVGCEVFASLTGHNVKSRAHRTVVLACYIHDAANRELDLVDARGDTTTAGSDAVLAGNVIVKAGNCPGNRGVIHFGQDGGHGHEGTLYLVHNTIVTPYVSPVVQLSAPGVRVRLFNNLVTDGGARQNGQVLVNAQAAGAAAVKGAGNWIAAGFGGAGLDALGLESTFLARRDLAPSFAKPEAGDYRWVRKDASFSDHGVPLPQDVATSMEAKLLEYQPTLGSRPRPIEGRPDPGAYEASR